MDKHFRLYTDLALEASEMVREKENVEIEGVKVDVDKNTDKDIKVTLVDIVNDDGSKAMRKPKGRYITIESEALKESNIDKHKEISKILAHNLEKLVYGDDLINNKLKNNLKDKDMKEAKDKNRDKDKDKDKIRNVLVVGLGNSSVTADSLGPSVAENIIVTRHLFKYSSPAMAEETFGMCSAIIPGVMGMTGMESSEVVKGVVDKTDPEVIVVIDALAARNMERINTTIQLTDTGIYPGSGVGNTRKILNRDTLGKKVIAIGVPTVVNALTLVSDICNLEAKENTNKMTDEEVNDYMKYKDLCVTPKEEDIIIKRLQNVIIDGINMFIHKGLSLEDVKSYLY